MRKSDIIEINGKRFVLYWKTALDGKTWCCVTVIHTQGPLRVYDYGKYFKTKKAARIHILVTEGKQ